MFVVECMELPIVSQGSDRGYELASALLVDAATDLQATQTPQDSYFPGHDRSTSIFDQRHRFVFSGVYQTGKMGGDGFAGKLISNWTFAPLMVDGPLM